MSNTEIKTCTEASEWLFSRLDKMKFKRDRWSDYITKEDEEHGLLRIKIYTDRFAYEISVGFLNKDYISCKAFTRRQRPGESFFRSQELFSGKVCDESFNQIMADITSNELIGIYRKANELSVKLLDVPEETE